MKRYSDVLALIQESEDQFNEVKALYDKALRDKSLDIRIKVKNLMENLRSILDYTAHDIYESICESHRRKLGKRKPRNIYFPYGRTEDDFKSSITNSLPDLEVLSKPIFGIIKNVQPLPSEDLKGCLFSEQCSRAREVCKRKKAELRMVNKNEMVRCFYA